MCDRPITGCPVPDCEFTGEPILVATHVESEPALDHDWAELPFEGPAELLAALTGAAVDPTNRTNDEVSCPVESCEYAGSPASVAGHVSGTKDDEHRWERLPFDGATAFRQRHGAEVVEEGTVLACPAEDCDYTGALGSVRAHVSGRRDDAHNSQRLRDAGWLPLGPRSIVREGAPDHPEPTPEASTIDGGSDTKTDHWLDEKSIARMERLILALRSVRSHSASRRTMPDRVNAYVLASDLKGIAERMRADLRDEILEAVDGDLELTADFGTVQRTTRERTNLRDEAHVINALRRASVDPDEATTRRVDRRKVEALVESSTVRFEDVFERSESGTVRRVEINDAALDRLVDG